VDKYFTAGQTTDDNMAHAHSSLDTQGYNHTIRICNTHCFSTETMDGLSHFSVTSFVICLFSSNFPPMLYGPEVTIAAETSGYTLKSNIYFISVYNKLLRQQIPRHFVLNLPGCSYKQYGPPT
jgi:hypothetical protein